MHEPEFKVDPASKFGFWAFLKDLPKTNFGMFVIFMTLMSFGMNLASPFFSVYVLTELHYDYMQYTIFTLVSTFAAFLFVTYWGAKADQFGNKVIFMVCALVMPLMPLLWLITCV